MSSTLYWVPVKTKESWLADELKYALSRRMQHEGTCILDENDISYLEGLVDAKVKDADKLISAIQKYKEIRVYVKY